MNLFLKIFFLVFLLLSITYAQKDSIQILIKMLPKQKDFFEKQIIKPFSEKYNTKILISDYPNIKELEKILAKNNNYDIIKVPFDRSVYFRKKDYICPISDVAPKNLLKKIKNDYYFPRIAYEYSKIFYIPRKLETRIMAYRVSKLKEALGMYKKYLPEINKKLKEYAYCTLPKDYVLEEDADKWDYIDLLVLGFIWAKEYNEGKIGHRAKNYCGTLLRLIDRIYQFGGTRGEVDCLTSDAVKNTFLWEHMYSYLNVYNQKMFKQKWEGKDLWEAFGNNNIFLTFFTQVDCYFAIGTKENNLMGYLEDKKDIDFAIMPKAVDLDGQSEPLYNKHITTNGWFWAIGKNSNDKLTALDLILYMTSKKNQLKEFKAFGIIPSRKDLLEFKEDNIFLERWKNRMFIKSVKQININRSYVLPSLSEMDHLQNKYYNILFNVCNDLKKFKSINDFYYVIKSN